MYHGLQYQSCAWQCTAVSTCYGMHAPTYWVRKVDGCPTFRLLNTIVSRTCRQWSHIADNCLTLAACTSLCWNMCLHAVNFALAAVAAGSCIALPGLRVWPYLRLVSCLQWRCIHSCCDAAGVSLGDSSTQTCIEGSHKCTAHPDHASAGVKLKGIVCLQQHCISALLTLIEHCWCAGAKQQAELVCSRHT